MERLSNKIIKNNIKNNTNEIIFSLYMFLSIFLIPISILLNTKIYRILFVVFNIIFIGISYFKNKKIWIKKDILLILIVSVMFGIDFLLRRNSYTFTIYFDIAKCLILAGYYLFRIDDYKVVLRYLSLFSKVVLIVFAFDPLFGYFFTTHYMGYGYAIALPSFVAIYLYHFIEKKDGDLLYLIFCFVMTFVFANRTCFLCIMLLLLLTIKSLKKCFKNHDRLFNREKLIHCSIIIAAFVISFGGNYLIQYFKVKDNGIIENNSIVEDNLKELNTDDDNELIQSDGEYNVDEKNNTNKSQEIENKNDEKEEVTITTRSYTFDKYLQVLKGNFDRVFSDRFQLYDKSINEIKNNHLKKPLIFIFGLGSGYYMSKYDGVYTHFIGFDLFLEYGIIGLIVGIAIVIYCFKKYFSLSRYEDNSIYLFTTYCLVLSFPKLLLSSYFQKEMPFFLFVLMCMIVTVDKDKNNQIKKKYKNKMESKV